LDLVEELEPGQVLAVASLRAVRELEKTFSAEVGDPADSLLLTLELEVTAYAYRLEDLERSAVLAASLQHPDRALFAESLALDLDGDFAPSTGGRYRAAGVALWETYEPPETEALVRAAVGQTLTVAVARLESAADLAAPPVIRISPSWFPWLPVLPDRIAIEIARAPA
jgi:hypothetical protein